MIRMPKGERNHRGVEPEKTSQYVMERMPRKRLVIIFFLGSI